MTNPSAAQDARRSRDTSERSRVEVKVPSFVGDDAGRMLRPGSGPVVAGGHEVSDAPLVGAVDPDAATDGYVLGDVWSAEKVALLPVTIDVVTAGAMLNLGRTVSYELAREGRFPVRVLRIGSRYRVVTAELRRLLGIEPS